MQLQLTGPKLILLTCSECTAAFSLVACRFSSGRCWCGYTVDGREDVGGVEMTGNWTQTAVRCAGNTSDVSALFFRTVCGVIVTKCQSCWGAE